LSYGGDMLSELYSNLACIVFAGTSPEDACAIPSTPPEMLS